MDENRTDLFGENENEQQNETLPAEPMKPQETVMQAEEPIKPQEPVVQAEPIKPQEPVVQAEPIKPQEAVIQAEEPAKPQEAVIQAEEPAKPQEPVQSKAENVSAPVSAPRVQDAQSVQQKVNSFYQASNPSANGCTYAYARPQTAQNGQTADFRPQTPPVQPRPTAYAPYAQHPGATAQPYATAQQSAPRAAGFATHTNEAPANHQDSKKDKKEKKPKNRMSFGQLFLCLALCLVVGSVSGYISSKTAVNKVLDSFMETLTTPSTTGSYNINIFEQQTESTAPSVQTQQQTDPTVPVANNASASDIYKKNVNSVVNITAKGVRTVDFGFFFGSQQQEFTSSGSGFFLTEDGYILTNYHVVEDATTFIATDYDGNEHKATLVGYEESNDIAVLKVSGTFQAVELGDSTSLEVGDTLLIIGNALGELQYTLTQGVVSYLERAVTTETGSVINMFQTDAAINSGNSGGPVFNAKGEVVGIASAKYASSTIEGLGFCIPIDDVKYMISDIVNVGYVTGKPSLGVSLYTNTSRSNGLPYGCYVVALEAGGAAAEAGLSVGDVITSVDGKSVRDVDDFGSALNGKKAGDSIRMTVYFADRSSSSDVTLTLDEYIPSDPRTEYSNVYDF